MKVWGVSVSYYTGKLETYLRYKHLAYEMAPPYSDAKRIKAGAGAIQVPIVELDDGRFMSDSTPILQYLESQHPERPVMPRDPVVRFIALLIEDYADEWLWRAAMHYRWSYEHDRALLSRILVDEVTQHLKAPRFLKLRTIAKRQRQGFVVNDGVTAATQPHVEAGYRAALQHMTRMLSTRRYLLGHSPSIADFGMMGPMLRHFGQDPTPVEIMRNEAPAVYAWVARMWDAGRQPGEVQLFDRVPEDAQPLLEEIAQTHLHQLDANAKAYGLGQKHFEMSCQGCRYERLPVSRYRVYCLEQLRDLFAHLTESDQQTVKGLFPYPEADILWREDFAVRSDYDEEGLAPFNQAINVYGDGVPS